MSKIYTLPIEEDSVANPARSSGLAFDEETFRRIGYQVIDEAASYLNGIRERPVWQSMPDNVHLDVWAIIQSAGRNGLAEAIANNNKMALLFAHLVETQDDLELISSGPLSIVRFRFAPPQLRNKPLLLDQVNKAVAYEMQQRGRAFLTSTRFQGKEALRACIVNYMTTEADIQAIVDETLYVGRKVVSRYS